MTTTGNDPIVGRVVDGRYHVRSCIARGGMATVYLATDTRLDRPVALKVMHSHLAEDPRFVESFTREARAAARMSHPGIASVYDQGIVDDVLYLAMEHVPGRTLRDILSERAPLPLREAFDITEQVLDALAAAHQAGLVHRDVKPENVLVGLSGRLRVADFGLARAASTASGSASGGSVSTIVATAAYLAPELMLLGTADARADVYATAVMLFEMLTGRQPFSGDFPTQVAFRHVQEDIARPSSLRPGVPAKVDELVVWAAARVPSRRPTDAGQLLTHLRSVRAALPAVELDSVPQVSLELDGTPLVVRHEHVLALPVGEALEAAATRPRPVPQQPFHGLPPAPPVPRLQPLQQGPQQPPPQLPPSPAQPAPPAETDGGKAQNRAADQNAASFSVLTQPLRTGTRARGKSPAPAAGASRSLLQPATSSSPWLPPALRTSPANWRHWVRWERWETARWHLRRARLSRIRLSLSAAAAVLAVLAVLAVIAVVNRPIAHVDVPKVANAKAETARASLVAQGFEVKVDHRPSEYLPEGLVVSSVPAAGVEVPKGSAVTLAVSSGPSLFAVPDLQNKPRSVALDALQKARLTVRHVSEAWSETVAAGVVISQQTPTYPKLRAGSSVSFTISKGREPVPVPAVIGLPQQQAVGAVQAAGLALSRVTTEPSETIPSGVVVSQLPADGTLYHGDWVSLVVSSGPSAGFVPSVVGQRLNDAQDALTAAGYEISVNAVPGGTAGVVTAQSPTGGQLPRGSVVTITVN